MRPINRTALISTVAMLLGIVPAWALQQSQSQPQSQSQQSQEQASGAQGQSSAQAPAQQEDPLVAAARKARQQKKDAPKTAKVFTNDNIPTAGGISSVGAGTEAQTDKEGKLVRAGASGAETSSSSPASLAKDETKWRSRFADLRHKLQQDQADLDVMQRELGVLNTQYYGDPNKELQQQYSRDDINKKTADIEAKKKDVEADKQALSDAEDDLRKAGGDPGWANPQ